MLIGFNISCSSSHIGKYSVQQLVFIGGVCKSGSKISKSFGEILITMEATKTTFKLKN